MCVHCKVKLKESIMIKSRLEPKNINDRSPSRVHLDQVQLLKSYVSFFSDSKCDAGSRKGDVGERVGGERAG